MCIKKKKLYDCQVLRTGYLCSTMANHTTETLGWKFVESASLKSEAAVV